MRARLIVRKILNEMGLLFDTEVGDIRSLRTSVILALFRSLVSSGQCALHGSNSEVAFTTLMPSLADDAAKRSGNQRAVYAGVDVEQVLVHATLNRRYLSRLFTSYTVGFRRSHGEMKIPVSDNVFDLFQSGDKDLLTDGYVYVLRKSQMKCEDDTRYEYFSLQPILPILTLRIPAQVGKDLLLTTDSDGSETVVRYSKLEVEQIAAHLRAKAPQSG